MNILEQIQGVYHVALRKGVDGEDSSELYRIISDGFDSREPVLLTILDGYFDNVSREISRQMSGELDEQAIRGVVKDLNPEDYSDVECSLHLAAWDILVDMCPVKIDQVSRLTVLPNYADDYCCIVEQSRNSESEFSKVPDPGHYRYITWECKKQIPAVIAHMIETVPGLREYYAPYLEKGRIAMRFVDRLKRAHFEMTAESWESLVAWIKYILDYRVKADDV